MTRSLLLTVAAVAALAGVGQAQAQAVQTDRVHEDYSHDAGQNIHSTSVSYADLDLASDAGRNALSERIEAAADRVCHPQPQPAADQAEREDYKTCRTTTIAESLTFVPDAERTAMSAEAKRRATDLAAIR